MSICLSHTTAQDFWLHAAMREPETDPRAFESCTGDVAACRDELARVVPSTVLDANERIHVLVPRRGARSSASSVSFHIHTPPLAPGALQRLSPNVVIVSPEYSVAQMALHHSIPQTALYGSFLCGSYRLPLAPDSIELPTRSALVNRIDLDTFLHANQSLRGCKIAQRALPWIIEGAASPPEAQVALRLCLPFRYGGYNLPLPQMNAVIDLDADEQGVMGKSFLKGDAVWPDAHLVVEYDGYYHASSSQMEADAVRRATLRHAGWTVIEVTRRQIISIDAFDQIAQLVAKQLGRRLRNEYLGATAARLRLIDEFFYS
ncbi:MAG: endonuclease domain-containing protein [Denitrobacterium sp.]|jgi:very-short-patch-repair endonuclease|nr:endonuclease domain-containing protein [Denitrobacterium sp.]MCI1479426.1 endonuclease domain-containing protein [Eggerthellaceae bacterium]